MEKDNSKILKNILKVAGVLSIVAIVYHAFKSVASNTETNVMSEDGFKAVQNPKTAEKLRDAVDDYHDKGEWDNSKLESIL